MMNDTQKTIEKLMALEWSELQGLMLMASEGHAALCSVASQDVDVHASRDTMIGRIADMSKDDIARALAPFAALGEFVHEHHPGHADH